MREYYDLGLSIEQLMAVTINELKTYWKAVFCMAMTILVILNNKRISEQTKNTKFKNILFLNKSRDLVSLRSQIFIESVCGVDCKLTDCLFKHLFTLPDFSSRVCSNNHNVCQYFSCLDVLLGKNISKWMGVFNNIPRSDVTFPDQIYHELSCSEMKRFRGYVEAPLSKQSKDFPIAFNILAHKSAFQLENLLRSLYRPQNSYCIHVDAKSSPSFIKAVNKIVECFSNVFIASTLQRIIYEGFTRLQADITCMSDHLNRPHPFKYLINTAAQAFPIKTNEEMVKILKIYNGANDIEGLYGKSLIEGRYAWIYVENETLDMVYNTHEKKPSPPHNIDVVRGSAYGIFSRGFVEFIIKDQRAKDFLKWTQTTFSPDEIYWATLHHTYSNPHLHTPGGFSGYPSEKQWLAVYANWGSKPCRGKRVRYICVNGVGDLPYLIARKEFFVNKFYYDYQPVALYCLASWIKFKESCNVPFDDSFYRTLNFTIKPL